MSLNVTLSCANDRASGGVKITAVCDESTLGGVSKVRLRRYITGSNANPVTVCENNNVSAVSQLSFTYMDAEPGAGISYTYKYDTWSGLVWSQQATAVIVSQFEGIVICDATGVWHSAYGTSENRFSLNAQKNKPVNYIITLSGQFPHRVSNARTNYWTGTCTAIWLPYRTVTYNGATCVEPTTENANAYRLAFMEWLMTDTEKYMKTSDGKAMIVSIDGNPQEVYNGIEGLTAVQFDWTQVGEAPGVVA